MLYSWSAIWNHFSLKHEEPSIFARSQWQFEKKPSLFYLIYRWLIMSFFVSVWITSIIDEKNLDKEAIFRVKWLIYLTNWGFTICMLQAIMATAMCMASYTSSKGGKNKVDEEMSVLQTLYKPYWIIFSVSMDIAIAITLLYWILIYDDTKMDVDALNFLVHGTNSIAMVIELLVTAHPINLVHSLWSVLFGFVYIIFSVIYHAAGGTSRDGGESIYPLLNWNKPGVTAGICIGVLFFLLFLHIFIYGVYWIRSWIHGRYVQPMLDSKFNNNDNSEKTAVDRLESMTGYDNVAMSAI